MITYEVGTIKHDGSPGSVAPITSFRGLSTDTKPTETYDNRPIADDATWFEKDTHKLYCYDGVTKLWT